MKIGKITIDRYLYDNDLETLREFYKSIEIVPLRVEHLYHTDAFEIIGDSPMFDETKEGDIAPEYIVIVTYNEDGPNDYRLERK